MFDADLAAMYGVETKALVRAVKRNIERFPADFMFQLSADELGNLRSHFGTSSSWGGRRYRPFAFTEQGVAMLCSSTGTDPLPSPAIPMHVALRRCSSVTYLPGMRHRRASHCSRLVRQARSGICPSRTGVLRSPRAVRVNIEIKEGLV
ncbi:MAG: ORF6N domain-containing protein [Deltaproteobacteria bacterium]|nr:ORF6N domain-containing protein [Deltaproteobacteria bacterium]